jgi:hypothetical protein
VGLSEVYDSVVDNIDKSIESTVETTSKATETIESAESTGLKETYGDETETKENKDGTIEEDIGFQEQTGLTEEQKIDLHAETGWSENVIDSINSPEEAQIYKNAGLQETEVNGKEALVRDIDPDLADDDGITNKDRMERGLAPIDSNGEKIELHHIGQREDSPLAELTTSEHRQGGNDTILHDKTKETEVHGEGNNWDKERQDYWKARAQDFD